MANPNAGEKNPVLKLIILMVFAAARERPSRMKRTWC